MFAKITLLLATIVIIHANFFTPVPYRSTSVMFPQPAVDYYTFPKYDVTYGLSDKLPMEQKSPVNMHDSDMKGTYSLQEPDGTLRTIQYTANDQNGFNAVISRSNKGINPQSYAKAILNAPLGIENLNARIGLGFPTYEFL